MKNRAYFIALSLGLLVVSISFTGVFADENKQVMSLIKMVNDNKQIKGPDKVVLKINGKPVSAREFVKEKNLLIYLAKINGSSFPSEHDVINSLAKREALYQKAVELGLEATDNEVREFVKLQRAKFEEYDPYATGKELIEAEIKATGLSVDEYWEHTIPEYKKILTLNKLSQYYINQIAPLDPDSPNNAEKVKFFLEQEFDKIVKDAVIEVIQ